MLTLIRASLSRLFPAIIDHRQRVPKKRRKKENSSSREIVDESVLRNETSNAATNLSSLLNIFYGLPWIDFNGLPRHYPASTDQSLTIPCVFPGHWAASLVCPRASMICQIRTLQSVAFIWNGPLPDNKSCIPGKGGKMGNWESGHKWRWWPTQAMMDLKTENGLKCSTYAARAAVTTNTWLV